MRRYIDADLLKDKTTRVNNIWNVITNAEGKGLDEIIDDISTADVVEVVRCKDCKWFEETKDICTYFGEYVDSIDYCSKGISYEQIY